MEQQLRAVFAHNQLLASRITALENLIIGGRMPGTVSDPAPDGGGIGGVVTGTRPGIPINFDPNPEELGKFSKIQIESRLADIGLMRSKLDSYEKLLKAEMKRF